jgi:6-phospho-beta-glucosidase
MATSVFRDDFLWGGATAANQLEGGYDADGKGLSVPDIMTGGTVDTPRLVTPAGVKPGVYYPSHTAIDFYHHYAEDIDLFGEMGLQVLPPFGAMEPYLSPMGMMSSPAKMHRLLSPYF